MALQPHPRLVETTPSGMAAPSAKASGSRNAVARRTTRSESAIRAGGDAEVEELDCSERQIGALEQPLQASAGD